MHKYMLVEFAIGVAQIAAAITIGGWYWWLMGIIIIIDCLLYLIDQIIGIEEQPVMIEIRGLLNYFGVDTSAYTDDELQNKLKEYLEEV